MPLCGNIIENFALILETDNKTNIPLMNIAWALSNQVKENERNDNKRSIGHRNNKNCCLFNGMPNQTNYTQFI